jgi:hypothetical protein
MKINIAEFFIQKDLKDLFNYKYSLACTAQVQILVPWFTLEVKGTNLDQSINVQERKFLCFNVHLLFTMTPLPYT